MVVGHWEVLGVEVAAVLLPVVVAVPCIKVRAYFRNLCFYHSYQ